jgi:tetratricopeptide (TPR) repeat protein
LNALYGNVLWNLGEMLPAYQALHHAHELNTQDANTTALLYQSTLALAGRSESAGDSPKALAYLQEAVSLNPKAPEPHQQMAAIYKHMGRPEQAKAEEVKSEALGKPAKD